MLTNNHVVQDADELKVVLADDRELEAEIVGTDPNTDLAVIKVKDASKLGRGAARRPLGDSDALQVGEWVMAIGSPFGLRQTVSAGIVSAVGRGRVGIADYEDFVQTDAAINPGNSGGPLVNLEGRVIGINTAIASQTGGYQGVGFAIPINMARAVMDQLIAARRGRARLPRRVHHRPERRARELVRLQGQGRRAGAGRLARRPGRQGRAQGRATSSSKRDGKPVARRVAFRNAIAQTAPGTQVDADGLPQRQGAELKASSRSCPSQGEAQAQRPRERARRGRAAAGCELSDLTPDLKRRLETELDARRGRHRRRARLAGRDRGPAAGRRDRAGRRRRR